MEERRLERESVRKFRAAPKIRREWVRDRQDAEKIKRMLAGRDLRMAMEMGL
jgi:hypothetical protein